ncbi:MAG TPA: glutathione peroxidase [Acidimicrobiales bacterium]|nr:glutathione peroxidase [Acidimicrobiales bacterium]
MGIYDAPVRRLDGAEASLHAYEGEVLLVVNVASACGFTPQYTGLQALESRYAGQGFEVLGFPCNQFGAQEPGSSEEIASFCETNYGVTFPMFEKVEVNGEGRTPLYALLTETPDGEGEAGDVSWNFEKFLVGRDGSVLGRYRSKTAPEDPALTGAIEAALGS